MNTSIVDIYECVLANSPVRELSTPDESNIVTDKVQTNPPTDKKQKTQDRKEKRKKERETERW